MSETPAKEGWMTKQGGMIKTWKKRWFMLVGQELIYSEKPGKKVRIIEVGAESFQNPFLHRHSEDERGCEREEQIGEQS